MPDLYFLWNIEVRLKTMADATEVSGLIEAHLMDLRDDEQARHLMRFFKTAPGEYGEGDQFLGLRAPVTRAAVRLFRSEVAITDIEPLLASPWHEVRLCGFLLLIELYAKARKSKSQIRMQQILEFYLRHLDRGNNWDLVDMVAPKILGDYLVHNPGESDILYRLAARTDNLWYQRVSIVCTWTLIRAGVYVHTLRLAELFMTHEHDLMHKATGWMLREVGKRGGKDELLDFLDNYAAVMPRTALRYAIEHLPESERRYYMGLRAARASK